MARMAWLLRYRWPIGTMAAIFLTLSFIASSFWWLCLLGLVFLLLALKLCRTPTQALTLGLIVGIGRAAGGVGWSWYAYPLTWFGMENTPASFVIFSLGWLGAVFSIALGTTLVVFLQFVLLRQHGTSSLFVFPWLWVLGEVLGSFIFSLYVLGPGSALNIDFSFGYLGYTIAHLALLYPVVAHFGVYGLSFISALVGLILYLFMAKERRFALSSSVVFFFVILGLYFLFPSPSRTETGQKIIAIDTRFDMNLTDRPGGNQIKNLEQLRAFSTASKYKPNVILFPEDSRLTSQFVAASEATEFFSKEVDSGVLLVDTARVIDNRGETVLRAFYHDLNNNTVYTTDKQYLVPQGEYVTYLSSFLVNIFGSEALVSLMNRSQSYRPGTLEGYKGFPDDFPGLLFCSESIKPTAVKTIATTRRSSDIVLHPVSHARFHRESFLNDQLDSMLRVQAVWSGKTIISAVNLGNSKIYYPSGYIEMGEVKESTKFWDLIEYNI